MAREEFNFLIPKPFRDDPLYLYIHPRKADDNGLVPDGSFSAPYRTINDAMAQVNSNRFVYNKNKNTRIVLYVLPGRHEIDSEQNVQHPDITQESGISLTIAGCAQPNNDPYDYRDPNYPDDTNDYPTFYYTSATGTALRIHCNVLMSRKFKFIGRVLTSAELTADKQQYAITCEYGYLNTTSCTIEIVNFVAGFVFRNSTYRDITSTNESYKKIIGHSSYLLVGSVGFSMQYNCDVQIIGGYYYFENMSHGIAASYGCMTIITPRQGARSAVDNKLTWGSVLLEFKNVPNAFSVDNNSNFKELYIDSHITRSEDMTSSDGSERTIYANGGMKYQYTNTQEGNVFIDGPFYVKTTDTSVTTGKTYFTKNGENYTQVLNPSTAQINNYYENISDRSIIIKSSNLEIPSTSSIIFCRDGSSNTHLNKYDRTDPTTQSTTGGFIL